MVFPTVTSSLSRKYPRHQVKGFEPKTNSRHATARTPPLLSVQRSSQIPLPVMVFNLCFPIHAVAIFGRMSVRWRTFGGNFLRQTTSEKIRGRRSSRYHEVTLRGRDHEILASHIPKTQRPVCGSRWNSSFVPRGMRASKFSGVMLNPGMRSFAAIRFTWVNCPLQHCIQTRSWQPPMQGGSPGPHPVSSAFSEAP